MRRLLKIHWLLLLGLILPGMANAQGSLLMARSKQAFPEAMLTLQESIKAHGYKVARIQRVDVGLTAAGFETDKYRIVFYGKTDEIQTLTEKHPGLAPYLPPSFSIFAEGGETLVVAMSPTLLADAYPELETLFARWQSDVTSILSDLREAGGLSMN
jgi:uncharacterized protein (DUF302 family)